MTKSQTDLIDYLTNVRYELDMMRINLHRARAFSKGGLKNQLDYNSHYESWAIHARNLYKFLNSDDRRPSYRAQDYKEHFSPTKTNDTKRILQKLEPEVFHMGDRPTVTQDQVNLADVSIFSEWVEEVFVEFIKEIPKVYGDAWREPSVPRNAYIVHGGGSTTSNEIYVSSSVQLFEGLSVDATNPAKELGAEKAD
jgi:hypothetical protein